MFIVLEGIDGAGKGRQRQELLLRLKKENSKAKINSVEFPDHQGFLYKELIKPVLLEKKKASKYSMFLSFALDQSLYQEEIIKSLGSKEYHFICDGYFTTNLVYNCLLNKNFEIEKAIEFAQMFNISKPDLSIFIDVDPEVCLERKRNEAGHEMGLDIYERSLEKQKILRDAYKKMIRENIFSKWLEVDGNGSIEEVSDLVFNALKNNKFI